MKIAICEFSHEANSFSPEPADFARFAPRADAIVTADPPGLRADPRNYAYTRISRPIYPLDPDTQFL